MLFDTRITVWKAGSAMNRLALLVAILLLACSSPSVYGQTFLKSLQEKIEKLAEPQPPTEAPAPAAVESEEVETLPTPQESLPKPVDASKPANPFLLPQDAPSSSKLEIGAPTKQNGTPASGNPDVVSSQVEIPENPDMEFEDPSSAYLGLVAEQMIGGGMGLKVVEVTQDSPAWKAGFQVGDRILAVGGKAIRDLDDLAVQISSQPINQPTRILINRGGRNMDMVVVMMDRSIASRIAPSQDRLPIEGLGTGGFGGNGFGGINNGGAPFLGVTVANLTLAVRRDYGIPVFRGAVVTSVTPASPAQRAGLAIGDCIVMANGQSIQSATELQDAIQLEAPGQILQLSYYRNRDLVDIQVPLGGPANPRMDFPLQGANQPPFGPSPEYVRDLQNELARVQRELADTQIRLRQLEERLNESDRRRRR